MKQNLALAPAQQDIYLEGRIFGKVVNNIGGYQVYRCDLDVARFRQARERLLRENDAYRLRFDESEGGCAPFETDAPPSPLPIVECASEDAALAWVEARMRTAFADASAEVFEDALLRLSAGHYWYFAKAHHLIMDGWGFALQMRRLLGMYRCLVGEDASPELGSDASPSFVEYMRRQSDYRASAQYANSREHWLLRHQGAWAPLFPAMHAAATVGSERTTRVIDGALLAALRSLAAEAKSDLIVVAYAALCVYFSRTCQRRDIAIGSPVHNRRTAIDKEIIGSIVNVNMHRFEAQPDMRFRDLIDHVAAVLRQDHRHGRFPLGDLVRALREQDGTADRGSYERGSYERGSYERGSYEIGFNYQKLDFGISIHGVPVETHFLSHAHERVPLTFVLCEYGSQDVRLHLDYALAYFDAPSAQAVLERVVNLLRQVATDGDRPIAAYDLLLPTESQDQFVRWQGAVLPLRPQARLHDFFEEQVQRTPDRVAVVCGQASLSYAELDRKANRLAHRLIERGAGPGGIVGICHGRSLDLVVAMLAALKSGAAYVPIDPAYPQPRIHHILADARPGIVIVDDQGANALGPFAGVVLRVDAVDDEARLDGPNGRNDGHPDQHPEQNLDRPAAGARANEVAYVIYTSGSTGHPKGVQIEHRNAAAFVQWALAHFSKDELEVVLAATSICFDLSIFELFVPLASGGRCVVVENVLALRDRPIDDLTLINTVPSAIRGLLEADAVPRSVRCINLAGEFLHQELVDALYSKMPSIKVYDLYGPSETTTYSTVCLRTRGGDALIGRPIANTQVYVLDDSGDPLPCGAIGEIHIGGAGLARGYLNQPALTAEKFVFNRHADARLYRTGDLARWTSEGLLQYRGRKDHQEKIRGFRVEPGEIEARLREHPAVVDCVVVGLADPSGGARFLAAYVVAAKSADAASEASALIDELAAFVAAHLPAHAVPSRFVLLPALPLTPSGKVDRAALPAPGAPARGESAYEAPRNEIERRLAALWQTTLGQAQIGLRDTFFSRGGDSLQLLKLASSIEREFEVRIELPALFASPTIEAQARLLEGQLEIERVRRSVSEQREAPSCSFIDL